MTTTTRTQKSPGEICFGPGATITRVDENGREVVIEGRMERYYRLQREQGEAVPWSQDDPEGFFGALAAGVAMLAAIAALGAVCWFLANH